MTPLLIAVFAGGVSWLLVHGVRRWARRRQLFDIPNQRSSHSQPTPRGGGLAIVVVTLGAGLWNGATYGFSPPLLGYLLGGSLIATVGWLDDLRALPSVLRFGCQLVGAGLVLLPAYPTLATAPLGLPGWLLAGGFLIWILALTNIFNFMDGIDGLAGGQALVGALAWLWIGSALGDVVVPALALALAAASGGFLLHNWSPARIFMGDVSSTFLGYTFASVPLLLPAVAERWTVLVGAGVILWPFVFDGTLTIVRRGLRGENIFQAHRSHLYQRLVIHGWSHRRVSALYIAFAIVVALCAVGLILRDWGWIVLAPPLFLAALLVALVIVADHETSPAP